LSKPFLVACGVKLFDEFDAIAPQRDKSSDGWIGDAAHADKTSDHNPDETGKVPVYDIDKLNEVHAIDVDVTLRQTDLTMEKVVQHLLKRCRSGAEKRLRYIIYNRRIWAASNGWRQEEYDGANPHTQHAHFSLSYDTNREASRASWELEDIPVSLTAQDKQDIINGVTSAVLAQVGVRVWNHTEQDPFSPDDPNAQRRMGGDVRMMEKRATDRHEELMNALKPEPESR
jgi:hypothetical protein